MPLLNSPNRSTRARRRCERWSRLAATAGDRPSAGADGRQLPSLGGRRRSTTPLPAPTSGRRAAAPWVIASRWPVPRHGIESDP